LAREAVSFIDRRKGGPFLLYLAFNAIHSPMQAPVPLVRQFDYIRDEQRRLFAAMLHSMDQAAGRVLAKLRSENLEDDTLVIFLSDNGGPTAELTSSNAPLRGGKGQLFEGGIRVPFCLQWKGRLKGGRVVDAPVSALDICPTSVAAAGGGSVAGLDGVDLLPFLEGNGTKPPHTELFWRYGPNLALRKGNWKLVRQAGVDRLFDLGADMTESGDLIQDKPAVAAELAAARQALDREMIAPLWGQR
jgi:arylsulfatase B